MWRIFFLVLSLLWKKPMPGPPMPRRRRLAALSSEDTEKMKAELIANTETMSILLSNASAQRTEVQELLSNASAQRPEVQELRHSTKVTFHEKIMYTATLSQVNCDVHTRAFRWIYTCIYPRCIYLCVCIVSHVILESVSPSVKYQCAETRGARASAFDSDDTYSSVGLLVWKT